LRLRLAAHPAHWIRRSGEQFGLIVLRARISLRLSYSRHCLVVHSQSLAGISMPQNITRFQRKTRFSMTAEIIDRIFLSQLLSDVNRFLKGGQRLIASAK